MSGRSVRRGFHRLVAVRRRHATVVPIEPQEQRQRVGAVAQLSSATRTRRRRRGGAVARPHLGPPVRVPATASGRRTTNSLPVPGPSLVASTRAAVHLHQAATSDRPMPSPPCDRSSGGSTWREHVEDARQQLRRDADAGVAHARRPTSSPSSLGRRARCGRPRSVYLAALFSRLANTCASRAGSASSATGPRRQVDASAAWRRGVDERAAGLDRRAAPPPPGSTRSRAQLRACRGVIRETSSRSSTQADHLPHLALDHRLGARPPRRRPLALAACTCQRVADRRQRVAQLVGERGQELVLAAVAPRQVGRNLARPPRWTRRALSAASRRS